MEMFRYAEQGSIGFLWVSGTNPAVSLPDLGRIRSILSQESLFLVVSDAFLTETARLADVVLPTALWGEKTGTFTNTDRTVHLSEQAVDPPGQARPDGVIFADYAHRLGLKDRDGQPLVKWSTPEECFEAWKESTRGRPCDYTGLELRQAPRRHRHPVAVQRRGARRNGAPLLRPRSSRRPRRSAKTTATTLSPARPSPRRTSRLSAPTAAQFSRRPSGRLRTSGQEATTRSRSRPAAPSTTSTPEPRPGGRPSSRPRHRTPWVELFPADAERLGISEGELVRVSSPRGSIIVPARVGGPREGVVFVPFHYGYWDVDDGAGPTERPRAANELTITLWDRSRNSRALRRPL